MLGPMNARDCMDYFLRECDRGWHPNLSEEQVALIRKAWLDLSSHGWIGRQDTVITDAASALAVAREALDLLERQRVFAAQR